MFKNAGLITICCVLSVLIIPLIFTSTHHRDNKNKPIEEVENIYVYDHVNDKIFEINFEEYVWRVVAREMSYNYNIEALKAQAVAARTYALKRMVYKNPDHKGADICTNPAHCSAFMSEDNAKSAWGDKYNEIRSKFEQAANETKGEILEYDNQLATTVFYAISSGKTENSKDVWGGDVPYLVSVDSEVDKNVNGYETTATFSLDDMAQKLDVKIPKDKNTIIGDITNTEGGNVNTIVICGKTFKGTEIRSKLGLRSADFVPRLDGKNIIFTVYGFGHGVGMSQTGANEYAKQGYTYKDILNKYYPGTNLKKLT